VADPLARAFAHTYWYALALTALALLPALLLTHEERKARRQAAALPDADAETLDDDQMRPAAIAT
jgi:hypothetical protein